MSIYTRPTITSPFTSNYPRYNRHHAVNALKQLNDFLVLDTETTGIGKPAEIIELAIVDYQSGDVMFNSLLHPSTLDIYETSRAREVSGISAIDLLQSPPLWELWPDVLDILQSKPVTAFNSDFDMRMIRNSLMKWNSGIEVPVLEATCLMKLITAYLNLDYWVSLEEAAKYFGVDNANSHRALADVLTTIKIVKCMKEL